MKILRSCASPETGTTSASCRDGRFEKLGAIRREPVTIWDPPRRAGGRPKSWRVRGDPSPPPRNRIDRPADCCCLWKSRARRVAAAWGCQIDRRSRMGIDPAEPGGDPQPDPARPRHAGWHPTRSNGRGGRWALIAGPNGGFWRPALIRFVGITESSKSPGRSLGRIFRPDALAR